MRLLDVLGFATTALLRHRLRTVLTLLGVAIGVMAVVALTALGEGARRYVVDQFASLGTNLLIVLPGKTETTGGLPGFGGAPNDLTLEDAEALRRGVPGVRRLAPVALGNETVSAGERRRQVPVLGTTAELAAMRRLQVRFGRFLPAGDLGRGAPVAVLGAKLAGELFPHESALGRVVRIGGWRMRVIGVMEARGTQLGMNMDEVAYVPVASCMRMFNRTSLFRIVLQVGAAAELDAAKRRAVAILTERHGEEDVTCITQDAVLNTLSGILGALTLALAGIAAISLAVAGVGIMNVMLVSVAERQHEVGLLKALGARRRQILVVFLAEAVLIALAGAGAGLAGGWGLVAAAQPLVGALHLAPPPWASAAAASVAAVVGVVFGVLPAVRATRLDPVAALHGR
ncbi:MAG: ABC transporter permease [Planctomycetes bacterium]|nr:ABC transporter permease [Planctomycetota bacterium]